jgi:hypothetical protein
MKRKRYSPWLRDWLQHISKVALHCIHCGTPVFTSKPIAQRRAEELERLTREQEVRG